MCEFNPVRCLAGIRDLDADVVRLIEGVSESQFHAPAPNGGWSMGFCMEHLILTSDQLLDAWDAALTRTIAGHVVLPYTWLQRAMLRSMEPPSRHKVRASPSIEPLARRSRQETVRRFFEMQGSFSDCVERCADTDAAKRKVRSPFCWLRYPLGFSFDLALAHQRRHVWQAWQVRKHYLRIATLAK